MPRIKGTASLSPSLFFSPSERGSARDRHSSSPSVNHLFSSIITLLRKEAWPASEVHSFEKEDTFPSSASLPPTLSSSPLDQLLVTVLSVSSSTAIRHIPSTKTEPAQSHNRIVWLAGHVTKQESVDCPSPSPDSPSDLFCCFMSIEPPHAIFLLLLYSSIFSPSITLLPTSPVLLSFFLSVCQAPKTQQAAHSGLPSIYITPKPRLAASQAGRPPLFLFLSSSVSHCILHTYQTIVCDL